MAAGHNGLERKVEHVTVMEVPDIKRWLKGNDFLITSYERVSRSSAVWSVTWQISAAVLRLRRDSM